MSNIILTRLVLLHLLAVLLYGVGAARYIIWPIDGITEQQSITLDEEINDQAGPQGNVYQSASWKDYSSLLDRGTYHRRCKISREDRLGR